MVALRWLLPKGKKSVGKNEAGAKAPCVSFVPKHERALAKKGSSEQPDRAPPYSPLKEGGSRGSADTPKY